MATKTIKEKLATKVATVVDNIIDDIPRKRSNKDPTLAEMFAWDTIATLANKHSKIAWEAAEKEGIIPKETDIRAKGVGEHLITDGDFFSVRAEIKKGAEKFDITKFVEKLVAEFKLTGDDVLTIAKLAEESKKTASPSLSLSVLEAA